MKIKLTRPSPAMAVALAALFVALGGSASAFMLARNSVHSPNIAPRAVRASDLGPITLRSGKVRDTDGAAGDGQFNLAFGEARCKAGERVIGGGTRALKAPQSGPIQIDLVQEGMIPKKNEYAALWNSDLGGAARHDEVVFAYCLGK